MEGMGIKMRQIQSEVPSESRSKQNKGRTKLKIGIGIAVIVVLAAWLLYERFFAYTDNIKKVIEKQLGEPIQMIQITKGDITVIVASEDSCERMLNTLGKWKGREKIINHSGTALGSSAAYYEKENFEISFAGEDKMCNLYASNEMKSDKSMRMVCGDNSKNYLSNQNVNKEIQKIIEEKQSAPGITKNELLQLFDEETGQIRENVTLADFDQYGQINVENNGEETCVKICMEDSCRLHVIFKSAALSGNSKPEKLIVFWSESEYKVSDQTDFIESIKEKLQS